MHPFGVMCVARADMDMYQSDPSPTEHLLACPLAPSGSACAEESSLGQRRTLPSSTQPVLLEAACERLTTPPPGPNIPAHCWCSRAPVRLAQVVPRLLLLGEDSPGTVPSFLPGLGASSREHWQTGLEDDS